MFEIVSKGFHALFLWNFLLLGVFALKEFLLKGYFRQEYVKIEKEFEERGRKVKSQPDSATLVRIGPTAM